MPIRWGENSTGTERVVSDIGPPKTLKATGTKIAGQKVCSMRRFFGRISITPPLPFSQVLTVATLA